MSPLRTYSLFLLVQLLWLLQGSASLMIQLDPKSEECLAFDVHEDDEVHGSFDILPETARQISFRVVNSGTQKNEVLMENQTRGRWQFKGSHPDDASLFEYSLCFNNNEHYSIMISFAFRTGETRHGDVATGEKAEKLSQIVSEIHTKLDEMDSQQEYSIRREEIHRATAESTSRRLFYWSLVKVSAVAILLAIQVYYLRGYFEIKTIV